MNAKNVYVANSVPPAILQETFPLASASTLHVVPGAQKAYQMADFWKEFLVIADDYTVSTGVNTVLAPTKKDTYYDLQGNHVITPQKGMYIKNGRKFLLK